MPNPVQRSFGRGELSPALSARADLDLYKAALSKQRNYITPRSGGIQNRPGTEFVGNPYSTGDNRMIPFVFSEDDAYVLVFGGLNMRVIRDGAMVTETAQNITAISVASWAVVTATAHGYSDNDEIYITTTPTGGMYQINAMRFRISASTADTFKLNYMPGGTAVNSSAFTAYVSGGTMARIYTLTTTFSATEVAAIDYAQYRDTLILTHPSHKQQQLVRSGHASWAISDLQIGTIDHVKTMAGSKGAAGSYRTRYKITYVDSVTGKETKPGTEASKSISGISNTNPAIVTCTGHGYSEGDTVLIAQVEGMTQVNNREFTISVQTNVPAIALTIASFSQAAPGVVTVTGHGYANGDTVAFADTGGGARPWTWPALGNLTVYASTANTFSVYYYGTTTPVSGAKSGYISGTVTKITGTVTATSTFSLIGCDSSVYGTFSTGSGLAACGRTCLTLDSAAIPTVTAPNVLTWVGRTVDGVWASLSQFNVLNYVIYKELGGFFGQIAVTTGLTFSDTGVFTPDIGLTPIQYNDLFLFANGYPSCVAFMQQRLIFADSNNNPDTVWFSRVGDYYNFGVRQTTLSDDAITATVANGNADPIRHMIPMRILLLMSMSSESAAEGTANEAFAPGAVSVHPDSHNGSGTIKPVAVNNSVIFTQKDQRILRDLFFNFQAQSYDGGDISTLSSHMFKNSTIVDMAFQKSPNSIIWIVLSDGSLVACTYIKDQSILAFSTQDTLLPSIGDAGFRNVCCIPEGDETAVYFVVERMGAIYFERMGSRTIEDPTDIKGNLFVDCALGYDGRHTDGTILVKVLSGSTYAAGELMRCHSSVAGQFTASNVGDAIVLRATEDHEGVDITISCTIYSFTDSSNVVVQPNKDVPVLLQDSYVNDWDFAILRLGGLIHLEGQALAIQGDGWVIANPNNDTYSVITVSSGRVTLPEPHAVIWAGLPYVSDMTTCDIDNAQGQTIMGKSKQVNAVTLYVNDTREFWAGEELPDTDSDKGSLKPSRQHRTGEITDDPPALFSEPMTINIKSKFNPGGRISVRNIDPLPCEIIAVSPDFIVGS